MSVSNSTVAHNWAHGAAAKGSNFRTDGKELISYNTMVGYNTGRGLVFLSSDSMTPSTGKQLGRARRACSHLDAVYSPVFCYGRNPMVFNENEAFKMACEELNTQLEGYCKARLGKYLHDSMVGTLENVGRMIALAIKYDFPQWVVSVVPADKLEAARVYAEQWGAKEGERRELARKREHARQAAQREQDSDRFNVWHSGGAVQCPYSYRTAEDGSYYIAVRENKVVTSGGAECPIEHARRGVKFWESRENANWPNVPESERFAPWHRNGERVQLGVFQLDRIEADGTAYAGCHKFNVATLNRLADILL